MEFTEVVYLDEFDEKHKESKAVPNSLHFIATNHSNNELIMFVPFWFNLLSKYRAKQWLKKELTEWIKSYDNFSVAKHYDMELSVIFNIPNKHRRILKAQEDSLERWAGRVVNNISWKYGKCPCHVMFDSREQMLNKFYPTM